MTTNHPFLPSPRTWSSSDSPLFFFTWFVGLSLLKAVAARVVKAAHGGTIIGIFVEFEGPML